MPCIYKIETITHLHCIFCRCRWNLCFHSCSGAANLQPTGPRPQRQCGYSGQGHNDRHSAHWDDFIYLPSYSWTTALCLCSWTAVPCSSAVTPWVWGSQLMPVYESRAVLRDREKKVSQAITSNRLCQHICGKQEWLLMCIRWLLDWDDFKQTFDQHKKTLCDTLLWPFCFCVAGDEDQTEQRRRQKTSLVSF